MLTCAYACVDQLLSGKQYKRAVLGLTLVYEAMMRYLMVSFFKWCEQKANIICRGLWNQLLYVLLGNNMDIHEEVLEII